LVVEGIAMSVDEIALKREKKGFEDLEADLIESELNQCLWAWASAEAESCFCRELLPKFRRLDRLRAAFLALRAVQQPERGYVATAKAAKEYASRLLIANEVDFVKEIYYRPCRGCMELYRKAVKNVYRAFSGGKKDGALLKEFMRRINEALVEGDDRRLQLLAGPPEGTREKRTDERSDLFEKRTRIKVRLKELDGEWAELKLTQAYKIYCKMKDAGHEGMSLIHSAARRLDGQIASLEGKLKGEDIEKLLKIDGPPAKLLWGFGEDRYREKCLETAVGPGAKKKGMYDGLIFGTMRGGDAEYCARLIIAQPWLVFAKNAFGETPLYKAALYGWPGMVDLLVLMGAEIDAKTEKDGGWNGGRAGETPLMAALKAPPVSPGLTRKQEYDQTWYINFMKLKCLQILIDNEAELDFADKRCYSPLIQAIVSANRKGFMKLLKAGADPNFPANDYGYTSLHKAAELCKENCRKQANLYFADTLIEYGADPEARYYIRQRAEDWENYWRKNGIPVPEGWTLAADEKECKTPIDYAEPGSEMERLLDRALWEKHRNESASKQLPLFEVLPDPQKTKPGVSQTLAAETARVFHPMTRFPKLRPPFYRKGSFIDNYYLIPANNFVNWLDKAFRKLIAKIREFFYI
jgi:ankyrin repeat protein